MSYEIYYVYRFDEDDDEKDFFFFGWCVVDDEDHEEEDGRRMKKMIDTNPNNFLIKLTEGTKMCNEDKLKIPKRTKF